MKKIYKHNHAVPYSLHDMRAAKLEILGSNLRLTFENGYLCLTEPYEQVDGNVTIEGVDFDFAEVYLLSPTGQFGSFTGEKMTVSGFLSKYPAFSFEIVDEYYGYNRILYAGFLSLPGVEKLIEMQLSLYYQGDIVFETMEEPL